MFDQLELTANEHRIATKALMSIASGAREALVSIASRARVECLLVEIRADKALLQGTNEITFSDENMEVGYLDHRRPLYLVAFIYQIPIKRQNTRMPNRGNRIWGKR